MAALVLLTGCRVNVAVDVGVGTGGSGGVTVAVTLDRRAASEAGDLGDVLRVADLEAAGWDVAGPTRGERGSILIRASKQFATVAEANAILDEITGPTGPFAALSVTRERSFMRTRTSLDGNVDLTPGLAVFGDPALTQLLAGEPLGVPLAEIERQAGAPAAEAVTFEVRADLPGASARWQPKLGERTEVALDGHRSNWPNLVLATISFAAAVTGIALFWRGRLDRYHE